MEKKNLNVCAPLLDLLEHRLAQQLGERLRATALEKWARAFIAALLCVEQFANKLDVPGYRNGTWSVDTTETYRAAEMREPGSRALTQTDWKVTKSNGKENGCTAILTCH